MGRGFLVPRSEPLGTLASLPPRKTEPLAETGDGWDAGFCASVGICGDTGLMGPPQPAQRLRLGIGTGFFL